MKDRELIRKRIAEEQDFIYCPRLGNSLQKLLNKNPNGVDEERICKVLLMTQEEASEYYDSALGKLKEALSDKKAEEL